MSSPINSSPRREEPSSPVLPLTTPAPSSPIDDNNDSRSPDDIDVCDGMSFASYERGLSIVAQAAEDADFAIVKRRKRNPNITVPGGYKYIDVECYMARYNASRPTNGSRKAVSARCGCPWAGSFAYRGGIWVFEIKNRRHNHVRQKGSDIPANRRRHRDAEVKERVIGLTNAFRARAVDVAKQASLEFGCTVTARDVQNIRRAEGVQRRQNLTGTQCFFKELQRDEDCVVEYELDELDRPMYVLFTFQSYLDIWRENREILSIDNTYKTNQFEYSLMR